MEKEKKKKEVCCVQSKTPMGAFNRNRHTCTSNDGVWVVVVVVVVKKSSFSAGWLTTKKTAMTCNGRKWNSCCGTSSPERWPLPPRRTVRNESIWCRNGPGNLWCSSSRRLCKRTRPGPENSGIHGIWSSWCGSTCPGRAAPLRSISSCNSDTAFCLKNEIKWTDR